MGQMLPLQTFELDQRLPGGFRFPARMTALPLSAGGVALVSPIPLTEAVVSEVPDVRFLIAPNALHHLYLGAAAERFPAARVLAPTALATKRPDLRIDGALSAELPAELAADVEAIPLEGAPAIEEVALFHRPSRTLVVTDYVFNVQQPRGLVANIVLRLVGCHGRLAQSRVWRFATKDRAALMRSTARLLELPFETLVMAHGEIVSDDARDRLREAVRWLTPSLARRTLRSA